MNKYLVKKGTLEGIIQIPASKSHTLRAILFGALGKNKTIIHNYLPSYDAFSMIEACRLFDAKVDVTQEKIEINGLNGKITQAENVIDTGNSGIVLRFFSAVGALASKYVVITGDESIRHQRPMNAMINALRQLGVSADSMRGDGFAPIIIKGPIIPGRVEIDGQDSQPVSALLIAGAFAEGPLEVHVQNPGEKPWLNLTLKWFDFLGIPYENHDYKLFRMKGGMKYEGFEYCVPGDFSSAAFPIAAALITESELTIKNLDMNDSQGDKELILVLQEMGARIEVDNQNKIMHIKKGGRLIGQKIDINNFIDAITILAVIGCFAEGETYLTNAAIARNKECDRISSIAQELRKMGAQITEIPDGLIIKRSSLRGAFVHSHQDHRMAMSLAVAGMAAEGETIIESVHCVSKTFPTFLRDMRAVGANIREIQEV